jgi:hypothetical protein
LFLFVLVFSRFLGLSLKSHRTFIRFLCHLLFLWLTMMLSNTKRYF